MERQIKLILLAILIEIVVIGLIYLGIAFILAEFNPFIWKKADRFMLVFLSLIGFPIIGLIFNELSINNQT